MASRFIKYYLFLNKKRKKVNDPLPLKDNRQNKLKTIFDALLYDNVLPVREGFATPNIWEKRYSAEPLTGC